MKNSKKKLGGGSRWWGQGGCERRIEVFVKIQKNIIFFWGGGSVGRGSGWGGQGGCDQRIEELKFFGKIHNYKKIGWGGGGG